MLRLVEPIEFPRIQAVYADAMAFAEEVCESTDWDISYGYLDYLRDKDEIYVSDDTSSSGEVALHGAVVLSERYNVQEWGGTDPDAGLYIGKFATGNSVRHTGYARRIMLPQIAGVATLGGKTSLRLNYMQNNAGLRRFYEDLGFKEIGTTTFHSATRKKELTTVNMVRGLPL